MMSTRRMRQSPDRLISTQELFSATKDQRSNIMENMGIVAFSLLMPVMCLAFAGFTFLSMRINNLEEQLERRGEIAAEDQQALEFANRHRR